MPAASGRFDLPCWCSDVRFDAGQLARVRASGARSCICARCAAAAVAEARPDAVPAEPER